MINLQAIVDRFGAELVSCRDDCVGICRDQEAGISPRGFYLDRSSTTGRGCFVVGLNPGRSKQSERDFFLKEGCTYEAVKEFYRRSKFSYHTKARSVIDQLGLDGPILWSNLAKCENKSNQKQLPPIQTMRHCAGRFLLRELAETPSDWPVIALGRDAFMALAYLVPQRAVIGIPHPTGGGGLDFRKMWANTDLRQDLKDRAASALASSERRAVWLGSSKQGFPADEFVPPVPPRERIQDSVAGAESSKPLRTLTNRIPLLMA